MSVITVHHIAAGETLGPNTTPGDVILVRGTAWESAAVRALQRLKSWDDGQPRQQAWTHVAVVLNRSGRIIEVVRGNVLIEDVEKYRALVYDHVHLDLSPVERRLVVKRATEWIRQPHGAWRLLALGVAIFTRGRYFGREGVRQNCAALVADALTPLGRAPLRPAHDTTPADLARLFNVAP